jgi:hypothetical protein
MVVRRNRNASLKTACPLIGRTGRPIRPGRRPDPINGLALIQALGSIRQALPFGQPALVEYGAGTL